MSEESIPQYQNGKSRAGSVVVTRDSKQPCGVWPQGTGQGRKLNQWSRSRSNVHRCSLEEDQGQRSELKSSS